MDTVPVISIFVRHSAGCRYAVDELCPTVPVSKTRRCHKKQFYPVQGSRGLRSFLRSCDKVKWLDRILAPSKIKVEEMPTMLLTQDENERLLDAI